MVFGNRKHEPKKSFSDRIRKSWSAQLNIYNVGDEGIKLSRRGELTMQEYFTSGRS
jgi:hypothetical protein